MHRCVADETVAIAIGRRSPRAVQIVEVDYANGLGRWGCQKSNVGSQLQKRMQGKFPLLPFYFRRSMGTYGLEGGPV